MAYDWGGTRILQRQTSLAAARFVLGHEDTPVATDLREWATFGEREEISRAVKQICLPTDRKAGRFDRRARRVWEWVVKEIRYVEDQNSNNTREFWQFPQETLALRQGDCEDAAALLASLLLAAGISPFCVRVVIGWLDAGAGPTAHTWPIYKDEDGVWRLLEATIQAADLPPTWPAADDLTDPAAAPCYTPDMCFNNFHVWRIRELEIENVAKYVETMRRAARRRRARS